MLPKARKKARLVAPWQILGLALVSAVLASCGGDGDESSSQPETPVPAPFQVSTLSSKSDMVSGGDTLLQVVVPSGGSTSTVKVTLNGDDVTQQLDQTNGQTMSGLVSGLKAAAGGASNTVVVSSTAANAAQAPVTLNLVSYPITGPILSGPHLKPYDCLTDNATNNLGKPLDADCSAATQVLWYYRSTAGAFTAMADTTQYPADIARTTTNDGKDVPYIVRVESGTINRGIYRLAVLDDPTTNKTVTGAHWKPAADGGWNKKLIVFFGCCGGSNYNQGSQSMSSVLSNLELSNGFAYMVSTELWNQQHSNAHIQGETLMMLKEHFIKEFGVPKWTAGTGGSGGSIQQHLIAQLFPGLLDGIQPSLSFPDSMMPEVPECRLIYYYETKTTTGQALTAAKKAAIEGFPPGYCALWHATFASTIRADNSGGSYGCNVSDPTLVFNSQTNPTGLRCDTFQTNINALGERPNGRRNPWGIGEARRPADNVGVQYGLVPYQKGIITAQEFVDLNTEIGGFDGDGAEQTGRTVADEGAVAAAYKAGLKNSFSGPGLANIPIITSRTNSNAAADIHDPMQDQVIRARLKTGTGFSDNQIILAGSSASTSAGVNIPAISLAMINQWLDNMADDPSPLSHDKVIKNKPSDAVDTCWLTDGTRVQEPASTDPAATCNDATQGGYTKYTSPILAAGAPMDNNRIKCQLKPIDLADYPTGNNAPTSVQLNRLKRVFPDGVCDWSKPGVDWAPLRGTYQHLPPTD